MCGSNAHGLKSWLEKENKDEASKQINIKDQKKFLTLGFTPLQMRSFYIPHSRAKLDTNNSTNTKKRSPHCRFLYLFCYYPPVTVKSYRKAMAAVSQRGELQQKSPSRWQSMHGSRRDSQTIKRRSCAAGWNRLHVAHMRFKGYDLNKPIPWLWYISIYKLTLSVWNKTKRYLKNGRKG